MNNARHAPRIHQDPCAVAFSCRHGAADPSRTVRRSALYHARPIAAEWFVDPFRLSLFALAAAYSIGFFICAALDAMKDAIGYFSEKRRSL